jgi:hypothetical protein
MSNFLLSTLRALDPREMPVCLGLALITTLPAFAHAAGNAPAARRTWTAQGVTFEHTADGIRAWRGEPKGAPAFSTAALLAAERKELDADAEEVARALLGPEPPTYGMAVMDEQVTIEVLSIVGPLLAYREAAGGYTPGTAHPTRYDVLHVLDLRRADARPSLLDYFSEKQLVAALKADPWLRKFADPEGGFHRATTLGDRAGRELGAGERGGGRLRVRRFVQRRGTAAPLLLPSRQGRPRGGPHRRRARQ